MSLFSDLARTALGALAGRTNPDGQSALTKIVTDLVTSHGAGDGLAGLVKQFAGAGLGAQASSWVSTGENHPVTGDQVRQALGTDKIAALAQQAGLPSGQLSEALAHLLPQVVDRLTPQGELPQSGNLPAALSGLMQSDWFRGLTNPR